VPKYKYRCTDCEHQFVTFHSLREKLCDCPVCGIIDSLIRIPGIFASSGTGAVEGQAGSVVKEKIKQFKEDLERQKQERSRENHE
jgi:putative FmdB family regulatory protein